MSNADNRIQLDNEEEIPPIYVSEERIEKDAPKAIKLLKRTHNLDLIEALGLSHYICGEAS